MNDKQEFVDITEVVYRGARKGRGLVVSPKGNASLPPLLPPGVLYATVKCFILRIVNQICKRDASMTKTASPYRESLL